MKAKFINEKFVEDSDPIKDMGIGIPEITKFFSIIEEFKNAEFDKDFEELKKNYYSLTNTLGIIILLMIINHFKDKYGIIFKRRENIISLTIAEATLNDQNYIILEIAPKVEVKVLSSEILKMPELESPKKDKNESSNDSSKSQSAKDSKKK